MERYIDSIDNEEERAELLSVLNGIQEKGTDAVGVEFKHIGGKIWELKIRTHGNQHRIFYVVLKGNKMLLLHAYLKKTPKAPLKEIQIARQRLKQLIGG
ncbi:MAG: type II toxin-antitoxin system RelE/ParE family toxin [Candidatus Mariimomonas ferrooxydans]